MTFISFSEELQKIGTKVPIKSASTLFRILSKGSPVKVKVTEEAKNYGGGFYDLKEKIIGVTKDDYQSLAHELGHAELDKKVLGKLLQNALTRLSSAPIPTMLAGIGSGLLMAKGKKWGILLPAALSAPLLMSEYLASKGGAKLLKNTGASKEQQSDYKSEMAKGLATYLVPPLMGTLIAQAVGRNH
jgi:hypothetical protein